MDFHTCIALLYSLIDTICPKCNRILHILCMSFIQDVSRFLEEFQAVDILTGIIDKSKAPRVTVS